MATDLKVGVTFGYWGKGPRPDLTDAIKAFDRSRQEFSPSALRHRAQRFNARRFSGELFGYLDAVQSPHTTCASCWAGVGAV